MKNLSNLVLTIILALLFAMFLPWWSVMWAAVLSGAIVRLRKAATFLVPFFSIFLLWSIHAWILSNANDFILSKKIGVLLGIGENALLVILITGIIGGIAAGSAGVFGNQIRNMFSKEN